VGGALAALRTDSGCGLGERVAMTFENWPSCQKSSLAKLERSRVNGATEAWLRWRSKDGPSRSDAQKKRANARGKRHRSAKHAGYQYLLASIGVRLTVELGWCAQ